MTAPCTISFTGFVKKQTNTLHELWNSSETGIYAFATRFPKELQLVNEARLSTFLDWFGNQLEGLNQNYAISENFSIEARQKLKNIGKEIFDLSEDQVNCFETFGVYRNLESFFQQARTFDPWMTTSDIFQASRNVWTGNYLQALMGLPVELTSSLFGYSMLYPVSDNYLDDPNRSRHEKTAYNHRFKSWLKGESAIPQNWNERDVYDLVKMIEDQYPRNDYPQVYDSLLAIHAAQEKSLQIPRSSSGSDLADIVGVTFEKGGTSVLADGVLAAGELNETQMEIIFNYGAFAQLMDDQEDLANDLADGARTLFTDAARVGKVDQTMNQVFCFAHYVLKGLDNFNNERVNPLKQMSMKGIDLLMIDAVLRTEKYYSRSYLAELELYFPFRFGYLKKVRVEIQKKRITAERLLGLFSNSQKPTNLPISETQYQLLVGG
jgi:hypothetical protein